MRKVVKACMEMYLYLHFLNERQKEIYKGNRGTVIQGSFNFFIVGKLTRTNDIISFSLGITDP